MSNIQTAATVLFIWAIMAVGYYNMVSKYESKISGLTAEISSFKDMEMTVTAYTATVGECDSNPNKTATMGKPIPGKTIAVSRDKLHLLGKSVWVEGIGVFHVNDILNERYKNRLDMVVASKEIAMAWGKRTRRVCVL